MLVQSAMRTICHHCSDFAKSHYSMLQRLSTQGLCLRELLNLTECLRISLMILPIKKKKQKNKNVCQQDDCMLYTFAPCDPFRAEFLCRTAPLCLLAGIFNTESALKCINIVYTIQNIFSRPNSFFGVYNNNSSVRVSRLTRFVFVHNTIVTVQ